ncbi:MAG: hypothetical protein WKF47_11400 [Geodermatophilaceae bacterium]
MASSSRVRPDGAAAEPGLARTSSMVAAHFLVTVAVTAREGSSIVRTALPGTSEGSG